MIDVWVAAIDAASVDETHLSAEERARAARFRTDGPRNAFIAGRALLRRILATVLETDPAAIAIEIGPNGKPFVAGRPLHFNLAHSGDRIVIAVSRADEVGVDIEQLRGDVEFERLARRYFAEGEGDRIAALSAEERPREFFRMWTRAEACLKATGAGMTAGLRSQPPPGWSLVDLDVGPEAAAALAFEGDARVHTRRVGSSASSPDPVRW